MSEAVPGTDPERAARLKARLAELEAGIAQARASSRPGARAEAQIRSEGVDGLIREVVAQAVAEARSGRQLLLPGAERRKAERPAPPPDFALVAVGGYGRAELSPRSDVDLLFVVKGRDSTKSVAEKALVERILYALWDSGLEVGHAVRTVSECVAVGRQEVTARSSMLDHRFLAGDRDLYATFAATLERRLFRVDPASFVGAKLLEIARRRERHGTATAINEPNLKEGEGGLRDAHTALWIARAVWGIGDTGGLVARGMARPGDVAEFDAAFERLLEVRSTLHLLAGRKEDRLSFDRQEPVARALGFQDSRRGSATELFMQALSQAMAAVQRFLQLVVDRMPEKFHDRAARMGATSVFHRSARERKAATGGKPGKPARWLRIRRGRLSFVDPGAADEHPALLLRLFGESARLDLPIHPEARDLVRRERDRIREVRESTPAVDAFWELLLGSPACDGDATERALLEMNDLGALGAFLPEFEALYYRVQHDTYHVYTCDAHLIIAACNVLRLKEGRYASTEPGLTTLARELPARTLVAGTFLHDIGKSERGHTAAGLRMLPSIVRQLRLSEAEGEAIRFLMAEHLTMSHIAQRRDLSDPKTIGDFATRVGTPERLKALYVLTYCDVLAVGPGTWTEWKGALLRELYHRTLAALTGGSAALLEEGSRRAEEVKEEARRGLEPAEREPFGVFVDSLPDRYFAYGDPASLLDDFRLSRCEGRAGLKVLARVLPERGTTEVTFQAPDRMGLFADLTGALSAAGLSIRTARIHTTQGGTAIDRFEVVGSDGRPVDLSGLDRMVRDLLWVMTGKQTAAELLARRKRPSFGPPRPKGPPSRVEVTNDASKEATVIDVYAADRMGLLHDIAAALTAEGLDIRVAIVSTKVDQATDSFYVKRIEDPAKIEAVKRALLACLEEP